MPRMGLPLWSASNARMPLALPGSNLLADYGAMRSPHRAGKGLSIRAAIAQDTYEEPKRSFEAAVKEEVSIDLNPPRGTRDFTPPLMLLRNWLFSHFKEVSRLFGFEEVDFPVVESEALFIRKAGEEITQQLYNFEDKSGRRLCLRPEITPSIARMIIQKGCDVVLHEYNTSGKENKNAWRKSLVFPLRWFTIGQCWRYERMTKGRRREHYQWNMDIFGVPGVEAEAELLSAIVTVFTNMGFTAKDIQIRVSNRKVLQAVLDRYSVPQEKFNSVCIIVDKISKISKEEVDQQLIDLGLSATAVNGIRHAILLKNLDDIQELIGSTSEAFVEMKKLFALSKAYGYSDWLVLDLGIVRGLAYYTGIVFEAFDVQGKFRAICGGGRYDKLISTFGGPSISACGFGFGDAVIVDLLNECNLSPVLGHEVDDVVFVLDEELRQHACEIASRLRSAGRTVDMILENKKLKWVFNYASRIDAKRMILLGTREWEEGNVRIKDLVTREETDVKVAELVPKARSEVQRGQGRLPSCEKNLRYLHPDEAKLVDASGRYPEEYEVGFPSRGVLEAFVEECKVKHAEFKRRHRADPAPGHLKYVLRELNLEGADLEKLTTDAAENLWSENSGGIMWEDAYQLIHDHRLSISHIVDMDGFKGQGKVAALKTKREPNIPSYLDD